MDRDTVGPRFVGPFEFVTDSSHPFADEQFLAVAVPIEGYEDSLALGSDVWEIGGVPRETFASLRAVHAPRIVDLVV